MRPETRLGRNASRAPFEKRIARDIRDNDNKQQDSPQPENDFGIRQYGLRRNLRGASHADDFVVLLGGDTLLVLLLEEGLVDLAGDILLLLKLLQARVGLDDLLTEGSDFLFSSSSLRWDAFNCF